MARLFNSVIHVTAAGPGRVAFVTIGVRPLQFAVRLETEPQEIRSARRRVHDGAKCATNVSLRLLPGAGRVVKRLCAYVTNRTRGWIARFVSLRRVSPRRLHSCVHTAPMVRRPVVAQVARPNAAQFDFLLAWRWDIAKLRMVFVRLSVLLRRHRYEAAGLNSGTISLTMSTARLVRT